MINGIGDTGFLVALLHKGDHYHKWADEISSKIAPPLLICEAVIAEASYHLQDARPILEMLDGGLLELSFDANAHILELLELGRRYQDRKPDFADLCLIRMSELHPQRPILTVDRTDFLIYRRNKNEAIPTLCPPPR